MTRSNLLLKACVLVLAVAAANDDYDTCAASPGGCAGTNEADANTLIQSRVRISGGLAPDLNAEDPNSVSAKTKANVDQAQVSQEKAVSQEAIAADAKLSSKEAKEQKNQASNAQWKEAQAKIEVQAWEKAAATESALSEKRMEIGAQKMEAALREAELHQVPDYVWPEDCRVFFTDKCGMSSLAMMTSWGRVRMAFESCCLYGGHPNITCAGIGYNMLQDETGDFNPDAEFCQQLPDLYKLHVDALKRKRGNAQVQLVQLGSAEIVARQAQTIVERVRELSDMYLDPSGLQTIGAMFGLTAVSLMSPQASQMTTLIASRVRRLVRLGRCRRH